MNRSRFGVVAGLLGPPGACPAASAPRVAGAARPKADPGLAGRGAAAAPDGEDARRIWRSRRWPSGSTWCSTCWPAASWPGTPATSPPPPASGRRCCACPGSIPSWTRWSARWRSRRAAAAGGAAAAGPRPSAAPVAAAPAPAPRRADQPVVPMVDGQRPGHRRWHAGPGRRGGVAQARRRRHAPAVAAAGQDHQPGQQDLRAAGAAGDGRLDGQLRQPGPHLPQRVLAVAAQRLRQRPVQGRPVLQQDLQQGRARCRSCATSTRRCWATWWWSTRPGTGRPTPRGAFTIRGVPPGDYDLEAWHEGSSQDHPPEGHASACDGAARGDACGSAAIAGPRGGARQVRQGPPGPAGLLGSREPTRARAGDRPDPGRRRLGARAARAGPPAARRAAGRRGGAGGGRASAWWRRRRARPGCSAELRAARWWSWWGPRGSTRRRPGRPGHRAGGGRARASACLAGGRRGAGLPARARCRVSVRDRRAGCGRRWPRRRSCPSADVACPLAITRTRGRRRRAGPGHRRRRSRTWRPSPWPAPRPRAASPSPPCWASPTRSARSAHAEWSATPRRPRRPARRGGCALLGPVTAG